jgi:DNA mismatch repair protein MutS2
LEYCLQKAALTLVTSHHGVLKQFAYAKKEVINASMEFDENFSCAHLQDHPGASW